VLRRVLVTCLGDADQVFELIWAKLCELRWLGPETVVVICGDGAEWIWNRAKLFPRRCEILDFWHAVEKAWEFARPRYGEGSWHAADLAHRIAVDLRAGRVTAVIARLAKLRPPEEHKERLATLIKYYTDNRSRMRYDEYLRLGYGIGSGAVESAHKQSGPGSNATGRHALVRGRRPSSARVARAPAQRRLAVARPPRDEAARCMTSRFSCTLAPLSLPSQV